MFFSGQGAPPLSPQQWFSGTIAWARGCSMSDITILSVRLLFAGVLICQTLLVEIYAEQALFSSAIESIDSAVRYECEQKQLPAFSIAIVEQGRLVWSKGYGYQDAEQSVPVSSKSIYRVGSVSKLFTDLAIMQLVEKQKLDLDDPVTDYLPKFDPMVPASFPAGKDAVTIRQLMSHLSGLVREPPVGNYFDPTEPSLGSTLESLNKTSLIYPPGVRTKYSNAAVSLVGAILEKVSEQSHPDFLRENIFQPLGMQESDFEISNEMAPLLTTGWMRADDGRDPFVAPNFVLGTGPAGNLYASVDDLARFVVYLLNPVPTTGSGLPSENSLRAMFSPSLDASGRPTSFGLGFRVSNWNGHQRIGHGGAVYGFSTQLEVLPEEKLGVVAVAALDGTNGVVKRLTDHAFKVLLATKENQSIPIYSQTIDVDASRAKRLVGDYVSPISQQMIEVRYSDKTLWLRTGSLKRKVRLTKDTGDFVFDDEHGYGAIIKAKGETLLFSGKTFQRKEDTPPDSPPKRWEDLIGEYGWDHNVLYILERQGKLHALVEWFYCYPLTEIEDDLFAFPDWGLYHGERLHFLRDGNGEVKEVVAASVSFDRRRTQGVSESQSFRIEPLESVELLRSRARKSEPPQEDGRFREADLLDVTKVDATIALDVRYATTNNFMGAKFYEQPYAFLQRPAAEALARIQQRLVKEGLGLLVHDAYRPWAVTKMFWDATPAGMKHFVANPKNGSRHNRGCAVDLTLMTLGEKKPITMPSGYDEFSERAFADYPGGTSRQRWFRERLRSAMEEEGFEVYRFEWWHFDYQDWRKYRIGNASFEGIMP